MTKRDFGKAVEEAAQPKRRKAAPRRTGKKKTASRRKPAAPVPSKELLGARVPKPMLADLRKLAEKMQRQTGRRVLITDLVTEAIADLLQKHR